MKKAAEILKKKWGDNLKRVFQSGKGHGDYGPTR